MRDFDEIRQNPQIIEAEEFGDGLDGVLQLAGQQKKFSFVCTIDVGSVRYEHVSVSLTHSNKTTPTWKDMCRIKEIFWKDTEEVHQIHPSAEHYVHCVGDVENVLHLWRPIGGWGAFEE